MKPKILNLEPAGYNGEALKILKVFSNVDEGPLTREELLGCISQYNALIVRLGHKIDKQVIDSATNLKVIASATTGLNHIDCDYAEKHGIAIISLKGETEFLDFIHATAEHSWALILSLVRHIPPATQHVFNYGWNRDAFKGSELFGKTLGIVGYGRLGKKVARYGIAFGMSVLVYDIKRINVEDDINFVSLNELLSCSDIVSLHVSYNASNHALIGKNEINIMKPGSFLINTSRGEILDETALIESLKDGHLAGSALDVMIGENSSDLEWMRTDPLVAYAKENTNLIITPHLGGCTCESMGNTEVFIAQKLNDFLDKNIMLSDEII